MKLYAILIGLFAGLIVLSGCGQYGQPAEPTSTTPTKVGEATVNMIGTSFSPDTITVKKGSTVTWEDESGIVHTVTGFGVDKRISGGGSFSNTFDEPGTYDYECTIHPGMTGKIIVTE